MNFGVLDRYLVREVGLSFVAVTITLLLILTGGNVTRLLGLAVEGRLPADVLPVLIRLGMVEAGILILPVSLFLAILMAFGRLYRDSEMAAFAAAGIGPRRIYRALGWLVVPLAILQGWLTLSVAPQISARMEAVKIEAAQRSELLAVTPGRFVETHGGDVIFFESMEGGRMGSVFIHSQYGDGQRVVLARSGEQQFDKETRERFLVLYDGQRHEGEPGRGAYSITTFETQGVFVPEPKAVTQHLRRDSIPIGRLLDSTDPAHRAELHWRMSFPVSLLVLALLALPLSRSSPRQGRFARLTVGILLYAIYFNLLASGKALVTSGAIPAWLGLWWVHALVLSVAVVLIVSQSGWRRLPIGQKTAAT